MKKLTVWSLISIFKTNFWIPIFLLWTDGDPGCKIRCTQFTLGWAVHALRSVSNLYIWQSSNIQKPNSAFFSFLTFCFPDKWATVLFPSIKRKLITLSKFHNASIYRMNSDVTVTIRLLPLAYWFSGDGK